MNKIFLLLALLLTVSCFAQQPNDIVGTWMNPSGEGKIKIFKTGEFYYGKLIWIKNPLNAKGEPKIDDKNPDESKRSRKIQGLLILTHFAFNADERIWEIGEIYDPKNGKLYSCKMTMEGKDKLKIRGFIGIALLGRTEMWKRVE